MSYCRFQNTLRDLRDCYENMDYMDNEDGEELSDEEKKAKEKLIDLCHDISSNYSEHNED